MAKNPVASNMGKIQSAVFRVLKPLRFVRSGGTFNRSGPDDLIQVITFQAGRSAMVGQFAVNLGIYIPELQDGGGRPGKVSEANCSIRKRVGGVHSETLSDPWWPIAATPEIVADVIEAVTQKGVPFLERFATRDLVLQEIDALAEGERALWSRVPRLIAARILARRGEADRAAIHLSAQIAYAEANGQQGHANYVRKLAADLGLQDRI